MKASITRYMAAAAAIFCLIISAYSAPAAADQASDAGAFIESLADQAIQALTTSDIPRDERIRRFRTLFNERFAVEAIGKWVLGRHWRRATPQEREEYLKVFENYIVASYVDRFATYTGEEFKITKSLAEGPAAATVFSEIIIPGGGTTPLRVGWRVGGTNGGFKVVDLVIEGVSMSTTLRSDFGSIVRNNGGKVSGLLDVLREKTESLKTSG